MTELALYTTIHPGTARYLQDWWRSVQDQSDRDFQLWIGVDKLEVDAVERGLAGVGPVNWVPAEPGDTPAQLRQRAFAQIVQGCDAVVLVDSDDVLHPSRVSTARASLRTEDVSACALRVVNEDGRDLRLTMHVPGGRAAQDVLPRHNIFGLSNTAYRCDVLRRCLPIPHDVVAVDWYLVTRAWLSGSRLGFDPAVRMDYRQHGANIARVRPPFTPRQVVEDTELVRSHFTIAQASPPPGALADRRDLLSEVAADVEDFRSRVVLDPPRLERYVQALNALGPAPLWWWCVAHPSLRRLWAS